MLWQEQLMNQFKCCSNFFTCFGQWTQRGQCPAEYRGNLCIRLSICLCSPEPLGMLQPAYQDGWMDKLTDGQTDRWMQRTANHASGRLVLFGFLFPPSPSWKIDVSVSCLDF